MKTLCCFVLLLANPYAGSNASAPPKEKVEMVAIPAGAFRMGNEQPGGDCPVERVSWFEAVRFCNCLSEMQGLTLCCEIQAKDGYVLDPAANGAQPEYHRAAYRYRLVPEYTSHNIGFRVIRSGGKL